MGVLGHVHPAFRCNNRTIIVETAVSVLADFQVLMWAGLAVAAYRRWHGRPKRPEALILATFGILAAVSAIGFLLPEEGSESLLYRLTIRLVIAAIVVLPYLLFQFAGTFRTVGRAWRVAAISLTAATIVYGFAIDLPAPNLPQTAAVRVFVLVLVVQWVTLSMYTAVSLWRAGRGQPSVARNRMRTLALGATGLSIVLIIMGTQSDPDAVGPIQLGTQILTLLSGPLFLLGFAPPKPIVWWWRRHDEEALRSAQRDLMRSATPEDVARALLPHAVRIAGGFSGVLTARSGEVVGSFALNGAGPADRSETIEIPLHAGSIAIAASPYAPYFGAEGVASLGELASLTDLALARAEVLDDQRRLARELQLANQAMAEFVAIASHDLRTPLTVVQGLAHTLSTNWGRFDDTMKQDQLGAILRQSTQLSRIVEDLLTVSSIGSGAITAQPETIDLAVKVPSIVSDLGPAIGGVTVEVPPGTTAWVDPAHLTRMLSNYLRNATTYGAPPIQVSARASGDRVELRVRDGGLGVPAEFRDRLFEKFWRADKTKSRSASGTGLGLAIVRGLARAGGGDAWYEHEQGGPCFAVSLPSHP